jgi:hypothetical protein
LEASRYNPKCEHDLLLGLALSLDGLAATGLVASGLMHKADFRYPVAFSSWASAKLIGLTPAQGARSTIYAATHPKLAGQGGKYFGPPYAGGWREGCRGGGPRGWLQGGSF